MDSKEFKILFGTIAKKHGFDSAYGGWFRDGNESIVVLDLQKSNYGDYYELNVKIFFQGMFGKNYSRNKDLVKKEIGNVFIRQPHEYRSIFNFEESLDDSVRQKQLEQFFDDFITPFSDKALNKAGILELGKLKEIHLTPAVQAQIELLLK